MGIFFTDFSDSIVGSAPTGWSALGIANAAVVVADGAATGGKVLRHAATTGTSGRFLVCDGVAPVSDVEVVLRARFVSLSYEDVIAACTRLSPTITGYGSGVRDYGGGWIDYFARFDSQTGRGAQQTTSTASQGVWFWSRFKSEGGFHYTKCWNDGDGEPTGWEQTINETSYSGPGSVGIYFQDTWSGAVLEVDCFGVGFGGESAPTERIYPEAEIDATTTAISDIAGFHPPTVTIVAETGDATASVEATYTLVFVADLGLQAAGAASQFEVLHASGILAAVAGNTEGAVATLSLVHVPSITGAVAALCENAESTITGALPTLVFVDVDATTSDAAMVLALSITFDVVAGAVTAPQPSIVGLVDMEFPLNGTAFALSPEIDSALTAEYRSYLQDLVLPVPAAYGTATYELTLQGVT